MLGEGCLERRDPGPPIRSTPASLTLAETASQGRSPAGSCIIQSCLAQLYSVGVAVNRLLVAPPRSALVLQTPTTYHPHHKLAPPLALLPSFQPIESTRIGFASAPASTPANPTTLFAFSLSLPFHLHPTVSSSFRGALPP